MKISIVLGTRPEIIKMSPVTRELENQGLEYFVLHTGQHYSYNMDRAFFDQLKLPEPKYNLKAGSGIHADQEKTGRKDAGYILNSARKYEVKLGKVMDYGCGYGRVAKWLAPHVNELIYADISSTYLSRAREYPFVSVIVATRNEERFIGQLLSSLINQTYPKDKFEVLIIDGMSEDATLQIVEKYKDKLNIRIFKNQKIKPVFAFNKGIDEAKGDLIMFVNAHSILKENFIEEDVKTFLKIKSEEPSLAAVGGICINMSINTFGKIIGLLYSSWFSGAGTYRWSKKPHFSDSVIFGVFDRKILISNGKFDEDFVRAGEDYELGRRLCRRGYKLYTNPDVIAYYFTRSSLKEFLIQTYNYGVARGLMVRKGYYQIELLNLSSLWFVPPLLFLYELSLPLLVSVLPLALVLVPMIIYLVIDLLASFNLLIIKRSLLCLLLPILYIVFHTVLGLSVLAGLVAGKKAFR